MPHSISKRDAQLAQARGIARVAFRRLVAVDVVVEDVALLRDESGSAYEVAEHSLVGFVVPEQTSISISRLRAWDLPKIIFVGRRLRIGSKATIMVLERDPRCKMISLDPETGEHNPKVLRKVAQTHGNFAGVYCAVLVEGLLKTGDVIELVAD